MLKIFIFICLIKLSVNERGEEKKLNGRQFGSANFPFGGNQQYVPGGQQYGAGGQQYGAGGQQYGGYGQQFAPPQQSGGCPLCDSSVYSYCDQKMYHDACCCGVGASTNPACQYSNCQLLYAKTCYEYQLIRSCCCEYNYQK